MAAPVHEESNFHQPPTTQGGRWHGLKALAIVAAFLGLLVLNVGTLLSDGIHTAAYGLLDTVLQSIPYGSRPANSPTINRKKEIEAAMNPLKARNVELQAKNKTLLGMAEALQKSNSALAVQRDELKRAARISEEASQSVARKIAKRSVMGATRNFAGIWAESVPYVGIGVMLTITAMDIKDACDNLRDLKELKATSDPESGIESSVCNLRVPALSEVLEQGKK